MLAILLFFVSFDSKMLIAIKINFSASEAGRLFKVFFDHSASEKWADKTASETRLHRKCRYIGAQCVQCGVSVVLVNFHYTTPK